MVKSGDCPNIYFNRHPHMLIRRQVVRIRPQKYPPPHGGVGPDAFLGWGGEGNISLHKN